MSILWNLIVFVGYAILFMVLVAVLVVVIAFALELVKAFFRTEKSEKRTGGSDE